MSYDLNGKVVAANKPATALLGYTAKQISAMKVSDVLATDPGNSLRQRVFTAKAICKGGRQVPVTGYRWTLRKNSKVRSLVIQPTGAAMNGTSKETWLDKIVRVSHNEIYVIDDKSLKFIFANTAALRNLGYSRKEIGDVRLTNLFHFPDEMGLQALLNSLRRAETDHLKLQLRFARKKGSAYDAEVLLQMLQKDQLLMIVNDITEKLIAEKKLLDSVLEKETLIKEMHHRVKNNLQLISSIVYLKLATIQQDDIRSFLEDTRQKIRSIALIHERLLQTEKLDKVEISDYLGKLVGDLRMSYTQIGLNLVINTSIVNTIIDFDRAIISGLIVNELVTNAMKHAFQGRASGAIDIEFKPDNSRYSLTVSDDGVGLPVHIVPGETLSFGMQLIDVFVKQLGGRIEIIRENGTTFRILF